MPNGDQTIAAALEYLSKGWPVIPIRISENDGLDKKPYLQTWREYQTKLPTVDEITTWWTRWPDAGIAVVTGKQSGMIVVDVDMISGHDFIQDASFQSLSVDHIHWIFKP